MANGLHSSVRMRGLAIALTSVLLVAGCRPPNGPGLVERTPMTARLGTYRTMSIEVLTQNAKLDDPRMWADWEALFITFQDELIAEARATQLGVTVVEPKATADLRLRVRFHRWTSKRYGDTPLATGGRRSGVLCSIELLEE